MKVKDVMSKNPITVNISEPVSEAARLMATQDIGFLPVEQEGSVKGIITDRDITVRVVAAKRDPLQTPVGDAMSSEVYACYEDQDIGEVARQMEEKQVRRVVVYDQDHRLAGIVSLGDIVEHGAKVTATEILEMVSVPVHSLPKTKQQAKKQMKQP